MQLTCKRNADETVAQWQAFWEGSNVRPLFQAIAPKSGVTPVAKPRPYDCAFGEIDLLIEQCLGWAETHEFLADALLSFMITFAHGTSFGASVDCYAALYPPLCLFRGIGENT